MSYHDWPEIWNNWTSLPKWKRELIVIDVCNPKKPKMEPRKYDIEFECCHCKGRGDYPRVIKHKENCPLTKQK